MKNVTVLLTECAGVEAALLVFLQDPSPLLVDSCVTSFHADGSASFNPNQSRPPLYAAVTDCIAITDAEGNTTSAAALVPTNGRGKKYSNVCVTHTKTLVPAIVCVKAKNMKEAWCLATSRNDLNASQIVALYGRRFTLEESFRDTKDPRFGMGLSATRIGRTDRRDRLLLIGALVQALLTLLGAASEEVGLDRRLKANTVKRRTISLFNQGSYWYSTIDGMREEWLCPLMEAFDRLVRQHAVCREIFRVT